MEVSPLSALFQDSEIGPLETVIIHEPGPEVEQMTPQSASELLYNEIVPGEVVRREHQLFRKLLEEYAETIELSSLLVDALRREEGRRFALEAIEASAPRVAQEASKLDAPELATLLVRGVPRRPTSFTDYFDPRHYELPPLPNLYFMRDSAFVFRETLFLSSMAYTVRQGESLLTELALRFGYANPSPRVVRFDHRIEGGDVAVLSPTLLAAGLSQRTSPEALDRLALEAAKVAGEEVTVLGVLLPDRRSTIHLDMVFTQLDRNLALVHGKSLDHAPTLAVQVGPEGDSRFREYSNLAEALREAGAEMEFIQCGGESRIAQEREQWLAGANTFALAPGVVITLEANSATNRELEAAGFTVRVAGEDELPKRPFDRRYALLIPGVELARGGGGPRCMTLPIRRAPLG